MALRVRLPAPLKTRVQLSRAASAPVATVPPAATAARPVWVVTVVPVRAVIPALVETPLPAVPAVLAARVSPPRQSVASAVAVVTLARLALRLPQAPALSLTAPRVLRARQRPVVTVVSAVLAQAVPLV
jgi:hypothetical protein